MNSLHGYAENIFYINKYINELIFNQYKKAEILLFSWTLYSNTNIDNDSRLNESKI